MIVAIEHGVHLLECTRLNRQITIAFKQQSFGALHNLQGLRSQRTGPYLNMRGMQPIFSANLADVVRFGLCAFGDDKHPVIGRPTPLLASQLAGLAVLGLIVSSHAATGRAGGNPG